MLNVLRYIRTAALPLRTGIAARIALASSLVTLLLIALLLTGTYRLLQEQLDSDAYERLVHDADHVTAQLSRLLAADIETGQLLAGSASVRAALAGEAARPEIGRFLARRPFSSEPAAVTLHDGLGRQLARAGTLPDSRVRLLPAETRASGEPRADLINAGGGRYLRLMLPAAGGPPGSGNPGGAIGIWIDPDHLLALARVGAKIDPSLRISLSAGREQAGPAAGAYAYDLRLGAIADITTTPLWLRFQVDRHDTRQSLNEWAYTFVLLAFLVLLLGVALSRIAAHAVSLPLVRFSQAIADIGDLEALTQLTDRGSGRELAMLFASFSQMSRRLRNAEIQLQARNREIQRDLDLASSDLAAVIDLSSVIVWVVRSSDRAVLSVSPTVEHLLGYGPLQFLDRTLSLFDLLDEAGYSLLEEGIRDADAISRRTLRYRLRDARNQWHHFAARLKPYGGHGGEGPCLQLFSIDITSEVEARREQDAQEQQLRRMAELSPDGILIFDAEDRVAYCNPVMLRMLGTATIRQGVTALATIDDVMRAAVTDADNYSSLRERDGTASSILRLQSGPYPIVRRLRIDDPGAHARKIFVFHDLSGEFRLEQSKQSFLRIAAHELRTPLAVLVGFSELLEQDASVTPATREIIQRMSRASRDLGLLVDDIFDLARYDAGLTAAAVWEDIELDRLLERLCAAHRAADGRVAQVVLPEPGLRLRTDSRLLEGILRQLLSNAFKFSAANAAVTVCAEVAHEGGTRGVRITVEDAGIGMSEETRSRLFERFFRAERDGALPGSGLGLALVDVQSRLLQARVAVDSREGEGTRISLFLPPPLPPQYVVEG